MVTGSWKLDCAFKSRQQWRVIAEALSGETGPEQACGGGLVCFCSECGSRSALNPFILDEAEKHGDVTGACV